ncbi:MULTISPECIES: hypothetical protein [unclassified Nocardiopsis]|uniref:hypothetical protein n=1 Tax=Nocardiopsis TaxID=2013 RepID=UPI00387B0419
MVEGDWRCGVCAALNEPASRACLVCDTVRTVARDAGPADLLAEPVGADAFHAPVAPPLAGEDLPTVRVMEPPEPPPRRRASASASAPSEPFPAEPAEPAVPAEPAASARPGAPTEPAEPADFTDPIDPTAPVPMPVPMVMDDDGGRAARRRAFGDAYDRGGTRGTRATREPVTEPLPAVGARSRDRLRMAPGTVRALALGALGLTLIVLWWVLPRQEPAAPPPGPAAQAPCPEPVAALIPGAGSGPLVESYQTSRHRIVLCADGAGDLYYFGEFLDGTGEPIVIPAQRGEDGYTAQAGETRYEISGGQVAVFGGDGTELARHDLVEVDPGL